MPELYAGAARDRHLRHLLAEQLVLSALPQPAPRTALDPGAVARWMPVDHYIGGIEHACMYLLYSRFFMKALSDLGYQVPREPFKRLTTQGMIKDGAKMSKSKGNVVTRHHRSLRDRHGSAVYILAAPPEKELVE